MLCVREQLSSSLLSHHSLRHTVKNRSNFHADLIHHGIRIISSLYPPSSLSNLTSAAKAFVHPPLTLMDFPEEEIILCIFYED